MYVCASCNKTKSASKNRMFFGFITDKFVVCWNCINRRDYSNTRG